MRFLVDASQLLPSIKFDSLPDRVFSQEIYGEFSNDSRATFIEKILHPVKGTVPKPPRRISHGNSVPTPLLP
jgi:hypothetical protein